MQAATSGSRDLTHEITSKPIVISIEDFSQR